MDLWLRHPGYVVQTAIAATILLQALLTLGALHFRRNRFLRSLSMLGWPSLVWLAGKALIATLRDTDFEGYVLLIAVALLCQALLTLCTLGKADDCESLV